MDTSETQQPYVRPLDFTCPKCGGKEFGTDTTTRGHLVRVCHSEVPGNRACAFAWPEVDDYRHGLGHGLMFDERGAWHDDRENAARLMHLSGHAIRHGEHGWYWFEPGIATPGNKEPLGSFAAAALAAERDIATRDARVRGVADRRFARIMGDCADLIDDGHKAAAVACLRATSAQVLEFSTKESVSEDASREVTDA